MQGIIITDFSSDRCEQAPQPRKFKPGAGRRRGYRGGPTPPCTIPAPARRASGRRPRGSENPERKPPPRTCIASQARATEAELSAAIARSFWGTYNLQGRPNSIGGVRHAGRVRSLRKGPGLGGLPPTNWGSLALLRGRARGRELQKSAGKHWESAPIRRVEGDELGEQLLPADEDAGTGTPMCCNGRCTCVGSPGLCRCRTEALRRPRSRFQGFGLAVSWRRIGDERVDQLARGLGDLVHRPVEGGFVCL